MLNFDIFNMKDYNKDLAARDALADRVTGEQGYAQNRDFGNNVYSQLMQSRAAKSTTPSSYGNTGLTNFNEAIQSINPQLYDSYSNMDSANKAALESANKKVGEDVELRKNAQDMKSAITQSALDAARTGATIGINAAAKKGEGNAV